MKKIIIPCDITSNFLQCADIGIYQNRLNIICLFVFRLTILKFINVITTSREQFLQKRIMYSKRNKSLSATNYKTCYYTIHSLIH